MRVKSAKAGEGGECKPHGTVTFFIQTFFIRDKVYTNFLYTGQSLYGTKFIQDKVYTGTKFIRGQSLYGDKVYTGQSSYSDKFYTGTKFIQTFSYSIPKLNERLITKCEKCVIHIQSNHIQYVGAR
jgi:hypothetical protein